MSDDEPEAPTPETAGDTGRKRGVKRTFGFVGRLRPRIRPYRRSFYAVGLLIPVSTAVGLAFPRIVGGLLDAAFLANDGALLNRITLGLLGLFAFQAVVNFTQSYLTASASERVVADLRKDLFKALVAHPPGFYTQHRVGELTSRLASDIGLLQGVIRFGIPELMRQDDLPDRRAGARHRHPSTPDARHPRVGPLRGRGGMVLRPAGAASEHGDPGQAGRGRRTSRAGVHADPHRAELHERRMGA